MHRRGKTHAAPVSDTVMCKWCFCSCVGVASSFFFFFFSTTRAYSRRHSSDSGWIMLNWSDLRRLGPYQAKLSKRLIQAETPKKKKKKKKECKTHCLNLITNPHAFSLHSNFSSLSFVSLCHVLCSLPLCAVCSSFCLSVSKTLSHSITHNLTLNSLATSLTHSQSQVSL